MPTPEPASPPEPGAQRPSVGDITLTGSPSSVVGDQNTVIIFGPAQVPDPALVDGPGRMDNLPYRTPVFEGRDLEMLAGVLEADGVVVGQAAVHGLGGIGKTELALQYAHHHKDRFRLVWWVTADTADDLIAGFASLARRLDSSTTALPAMAAARWATAWLREHPDWLVVLDNADDWATVDAYLKILAGHGRILVTTRLDLHTAGWARYGLTPVAIGVLDRAASRRVLHELTGLPDDDTCDQLAGFLGDLPLALDQAAAYISARSALTFAGYQRLLTEHFLRVAAAPGAAGDRDRTITAIWQASLDAAGQQAAAAHRVMNTLAWLAPIGVPPGLLVLSGGDPLEVADALAALARYSLITDRGAEINVHRLVQATMRSHADPSRSAHPIAVAGLLTDALPREGDPHPQEAWAVVVPHVTAFLEHARLYSWGAVLGPSAWPFAMLKLLHQIVDSYQVLFQPRLEADATINVEGLSGLREGMRRFSKDIQLVPTSAEASRVLGILHRHVCDVITVIPLLDSLASANRGQLGPDHPDTALTEQALAWAEWIVAMQEQGLGLPAPGLPAAPPP